MKTLEKIEIIPVKCDTIPDVLEEGHIYISEKYRIAIHNCLCGCGNQAVTPLADREWKITFKGEKVSFTPSIRNRICGTHYIITNNIANVV